ncbi:SWIB complex BAF60b domain-containing protein [Perilla frutescens var. hirtella]|uniref:SWIB complex BAF60b domain-containing protein n=1 Tax=Perilla frutescens var. hirtella TaxID=608512 RepID=A0AAD4PE71_PERFH|nr:SWIB complex BAF60b domain-containing protein [Perilla frutescens var. frutescens]KAH6775795.1 SWIB complex BAF60b domain-containing protein [Perilla frutescens var. hirtella]KAH6835647.1 SWIB complex BAF60b domain-containing protein [Perilla frutescens var. hirtella]
MTERGAAAPPAGMAVTEQQLAQALESLLRETNAATTISGVVEQLESKLGVNLVHKIDFIRSQIHHFLLLQSQPQNFMTHYQQQKDHFAIHQNPNFPHAPAAHLPPNFTAHHAPEGYAFRHPPPPPPPQPQSPPTPPASVENTTSTASAGVSAKESASTGKKRRGGPGGLNKLCNVSPLLQAIVGQPALPRTEIVKQLWAYIRKNNLQDPNNKRKIICNEELRLVFETDCTDMFKMNKLLAKHITALEPTKQMAQDAKRLKIDVESGTDKPVPIVIISEALASFFGTEEREMSQAEVLRQIWEYIKVHQLEDPSNSTAILCDGKLHELLSCERISALEIPEMLAQRHLFKKS